MLSSAVSILFGLVVLSVPIAAVLGIMALVLAAMYSPMPLYRALGDIYWSNSIDFILVAIPLFILMGEILLRSGIAERMYGALSQWLSWLPGGLMHSNIGASTLFAATSGSSTDFVLNLGLTPIQTMAVIVLGFLVLGCFMEAFSLLLIATPLVAPIVSELGFDLVWFGILMMLLLETALITPPIGVNLYVIQGVRGRGPMNDVIVGSIPFVVALLAMIVALIVWPEIALWLPGVFG